MSTDDSAAPQGDTAGSPTAAASELSQVVGTLSLTDNAGDRPSTLHSASEEHPENSPSSEPLNSLHRKDISLDMSALHQLEEQQKELLDTVDSLRNLGIGQVISLPQIIVVGDQSSGKSSVLEAISRVRFPVKDGLCTRFATELVLRKAATPRVSVTIQKHGRGDATSSFEESDFSREDLPKIIEEASRHMNCDAALGGFSEDLLRVSLYGPDLMQLTLVDLPGIYHAGSETQSEQGSQVVNRLVEKYMASPNSIILSIVSARSEIVLQQVLSKAKKFDPERKRTLGIITKPDTVAPGTREEARFIRLANNCETTQVLAHGWHVLRNRSEGEEDTSDDERDAKEAEFFATGEWSSVSKRNKGVGELRQKLSRVLLDKIEENMPDLVHRIGESVREREAKLLELGESRSTPSEYKAFLVNISQRFHRTAYNAIIGHYNDDFFGGLEEQNRIFKLRALVRDLNRAFDFVLQTWGAQRNIVTDDDNDDGVEVPPFLLDYVHKFPVSGTPSILVEDLYSEIENSAAANQGIEFPGSPNDQLALELFRSQSSKWEAIASYHIISVTKVCRVFVETLLQHITGGPSSTYNALRCDFVEPFFENKEAQLAEKLTELLDHYRTGYGVCLDHDFKQRQSLREKRRLAKLVSRTLKDTRPDLFHKAEATRLDEKSLERSIMNTSYAEESCEFGADRVIDLAMTYYELSQRTFAENVIVLAIENCLVRHIPDILDLGSFHNLSDDQLEALAAEPRHVRQDRENLQGELKALKQGLKLCQRSCRARTRTALPTDLASVISPRSVEERPETPTQPRAKVAAPGLFAFQNAEPTPASTPDRSNGPSPAFGAAGSSVTSFKPLFQNVAPFGSPQHTPSSSPQTIPRKASKQTSVPAVKLWAPTSEAEEL